ncbi:large ribosomal RNA subunit accumulation protein YCED homolog 2, chloroplastic isoform X1 [Arachis stenosperma]|uniref:large ribosomal RNA subunit accumulation protein YCED homolog 2, chloroplastic isoform X1 n=1 Tax=Arachis stenosperma TaxID=217475 RepID=UPI0025AB62E7|nr:large ribosomal RNA subunit accumulation protein YCED homolog 2, chloroplastic isoform X1 [Arachis stenosperma]
MAKVSNLVSPRIFNSVFNPCHQSNTIRLHSQLNSHNHSNNAIASTKRNDNFHSPLIGKNTSRATRRRLITISPGDGRYHGDWTSNYHVSLQELQLQDLIEDDNDQHKDAQVFIKLNIQKHASFGLSVDGRVMTSFTRKCGTCCSPYCQQIDANFNVWVLMANRDNRKMQLPEIGGDPSVIYVRPGSEVNLDSLVQDAIRLNSTVKVCALELEIILSSYFRSFNFFFHVLICRILALSCARNPRVQYYFQVDKVRPMLIKSGFLDYWN